MTGIDKSGEPFYFEDFEVGQKHPSHCYTVSKEEIIQFAKRWDPQPFHVDEAAAKASLFGGLTACSAHVFSIFCHMSQNWESGRVQQALASFGFDEMRMHKPVYAGDTLRHVSVVEEARLSNSTPGAGIIATRSHITNQDGEEVFSVKCAFLVSRRSPAD